MTPESAHAAAMLGPTWELFGDMCGQLAERLYCGAVLIWQATPAAIGEWWWAI